ncbi:MAG TPA: ATP-binding protein [Polyangiaceae bacterium]|nr:ATP-binding protein [Polyangiaceae bacterium]
MFSRLLEPPKGTFLLLGPRGTGKTTWLSAHFADALRIDLLEEARYQRYLADAAAFERELGSARDGSWVVVDEVQRLPSLLNEVHRQIETRRLKFALTGSSARKLKRAGVNLLGGRAVRRTMFPLSPAELGTDFSIERVLSSGSLPVVWTAEDPDDTLEAYVHTYMKEEIQAEALVRNLPGYARFLPVAALFHGQVLNAAGLSRDAGVARTTVLEYLSILEDTLLATRLEAYEGKLRVRERKHPKLYFIDPGLVRTLKGARGPAAADEQGALLEGFVFMLLRLYADLKKLPPHQIYYWSPAEARNTEVDFLLVAGKTSVALEVKAGKRVRSDHFVGLRAVEGLAGLKRRVLVSASGEVGATPDGIEILSVERLVAELENGTLFP